MAQVTKQGNAYLFKMKFAKGQSINYKVKAETTGTMASVVGMDMGMLVKDVQNGVASVEVSMGQMTMNGKAMGQGGGQGMKQLVKMDANGKAVGGNFSGMSGNLPTKPVKIGDTWSASAPMAGPGMNGNMNATYKFTGFKPIGGKNCAVISVTMTGVTSGSGTIFINSADGSMVSTTIKTSTKITDPQTKKTTAMGSTVTVNRV
jgi:hypothetical protein